MQLFFRLVMFGVCNEEVFQAAVVQHWLGRLVVGEFCRQIQWAEHMTHEVQLQLRQRQKDRLWKGTSGNGEAELADNQAMVKPPNTGASF